MHDIDPTQREAQMDSLEGEAYEYEYPEEMESDTEEEGDFEAEEELEMELAEELLSVSSEEELDQFIGALLGAAPSIIGGIGKLFGGRKRRRRRRQGEYETEEEAETQQPPRRRRRRGGFLRKLGGALKGIAKTALPFVGGALGSVVPGVGTAIGGALGSAVGNLFEAELDSEDQEFDQALRFVRLGRRAVRHLQSLPPNVDPRQAVFSSIKSAAQSVVKEIQPGAPTNGSGASAGPSPAAAAPPPSSSGRRGGRWIRRGSQIILLGA
jgi:hypothetical protein